jgi:hypothetical protein
MGRPPSEKALTSAERVRALRARRASLLGTASDDALGAASGPGLPVAVLPVAGRFADIDEQIARAVREAEAVHQRLPVQSPQLSEDAYVALTLASVERNNPRDARLQGERRLRAERYARWVYRGYCAGVVASLV